MVIVTMKNAACVGMKTMKNKPCPFCGEDHDEIVKPSVVVNQCWIAHVRCINCGCIGPVHYDAESPTSAVEGAWFNWNERH